MGWISDQERLATRGRERLRVCGRENSLKEIAEGNVRECEPESNID